MEEDDAAADELRQDEDDGVPLVVVEILGLEVTTLCESTTVVVIFS